MASKKRKATTGQDKELDWLDKQLEKYLEEPKVEEKSIEAGVDFLEKEIGDEGDDEVNIEEEEEGILLIKEQCTNMCSKRTGKSCKKNQDVNECLNKMCFTCCMEQSNEVSCNGHLRMRLKLEAEERYIEEGLNEKLRKKTKFLHFEDKFQNYGQTVVIWCLKDFCQNKRYARVCACMLSTFDDFLIIRSNSHFRTHTQNFQ